MSLENHLNDYSTHPDSIDPALIAQLASKIYNEVPGSGEIPRSESDVTRTAEAYASNPEKFVQQAPTGSFAFPFANENTSEVETQGASVLSKITGLDTPVIPNAAKCKERIDSASDYYFLSETATNKQVPLSSHVENLVNQQAFRNNTESSPDLQQFVHKVQSISGGIPADEQASPFFETLNTGLWNNFPDFTFLYAQEQTQGIQNLGHLPHASDYYFLKTPRPFYQPHDIFDVQAIRRDFPILHQSVHGKPLVWFDNAATTQKPNVVIDALNRFYREDNSNIHRGAHTLAARSTDAFEGAREKVRNFIGASSTEEIIFVRGTTEGVNLVAQTWGRKFIQPGDEILISLLEHHANIVPWQILAKEKGAVLKAIPVNDNGEILMDEYVRLLNPRTKILAVTQASNGLGTILPVKEMIKLARQFDIKVLVDGAQSVAHIPVNVQELDADFFVFSGHKIFAPNGIGVVYGKKALLEAMPPWQGGGNMIKDVTLEETRYNGLPNKFEAGTPNVADTVGLGIALDYVTKIGLDNIARYEHLLTEYGTQQLSTIQGLRLIGTAKNKVGVLSFVLRDFPIEQVGKYLDQEGIAVRAGHHCTQPSLRRFGVEGTVRPSLSIYNTKEEIDRLVDALKNIRHRIL
jgi:cysteine desulfurase / selenocysteine lyase